MDITLQAKPRPNDPTDEYLITKIQQAKGSLTHQDLFAKGRKTFPFIDTDSTENVSHRLEKKKSMSKKRNHVMEDFIIDKVKLLPEGFSDIESIKEAYMSQKAPRLDQDLISWSLSCHTGGVTSVAISNDGKYIISGSMDNTIRFFDLNKRREEECLQTYDKKGINSIALSVDNKYVVSGSSDSVINVFELATKNRVHYLNKIHQKSIKLVSISRDNRYLISKSEQEPLIIFDLIQKEKTFELQDLPQEQVKSMVASNDGKLIAFISNNTAIKVYSIDLRKEVSNFQDAHGNKPILSLAISKNNRYLSSGGSDLKVFDLQTKTEVCCFPGVQEDPIRSIIMSNNNKLIITGTEKGSIRVFDLDTRNQIKEFALVHEGAILSLAISSDDKMFVSGSQDTTIKLFDLELNQEIHHFKQANKRGISTVTTSKDNRYIFSASFEENVIDIYDIETSKKLGTLQVENENKIQRIFSIKTSRDDGHLIAAWDRSIGIFDLQEKKQIFHLKDIHTGSMSSMALSDDNKYIGLGSSEGVIKLFSLSLNEENPLQEIYQFEKLNKCKYLSNGFCYIIYSAITSLSFAKDSQFIIAGLQNESVRMYDIHTKEQILHLEKLVESNSIYRFLSAVSNDGKYLVVSKIWDLKLFDLGTKELLYNFKGAHKGLIFSLAISNDSRYLVTGSGADTVKVFDLHTRQEIHHYKKVHNANITTLALSSDNQKIVTGSTDGSLKVLKLEMRQQLDHLTNLENTIKTSLAVSKDNKYLVIGSDATYSYVPGQDFTEISSFIKVIDIHFKKEVHEFKDAHKGKINKLIISNNSRYIISASEDKSIKIFDLRLKSQTHAFHNAHQDDIISVCVSSDNTKIISCARDDSIKVFDVNKKQELKCLMHNSENPKKVSAVTITNDNKYIISSSDDGSIKFWSFSTYEELFCFKNAHSIPIGSIAVTNNSKLLISSSKYVGITRIWDLETMQLVKNFGNEADEYTINAGFKSGICLTNDDRYAVVLSGSMPLKIIDLKTMKQLHQFKDEEINLAQACALSGDNKIMITSFNDGTIKFHGLPFTNEDIIYFASSQIPAYLLLGQYDDIFWEQFNDFQSRDRFLTSYQDMYVVPHSWTILHLMAIFKPSDISQVAIYSYFRTPFLVDSYGKTPLHYLVAHDNLDYSAANVLLKYILEYLEDQVANSPFEYKRVCDSLSDLFPFIITKANPRLAQKYLKLLFAKSTVPFSYTLPSFGLHEKKQTFSKTPAMLPDVLAKLYEEGEEQVVFRASMLYVDYDSKSEDMINTAKLLTYIQDEEVFKTPLIDHLIDHLWESTKATMIIISFFFAILMVLISVYIGLGERNLGLEIPILLLGLAFLAIECVQAYSLKSKYLKSVWNIMDLIHLLLIVAFIIMRFADSEDILAQQWMASAILIDGFIRWVSYLRLLTSTRILIQIIITVLYDMIGFIIIMGSIIIGFSLIFLTFNRNQDDPQEYPYHLYGTYKLIYATFDDSSYNVSQNLLLSLILFMINIVLLNLLISIMGDSYAKVQSKRILINGLIRLEMILEAAAIKRIIMGRKTSGKGYLVYCEPNVETEQDLQKLEWDERFDQFKKLLDEKIENTEKRMNKKIESLEKLIVANHDEILKTIKANQIK